MDPYNPLVRPLLTDLYQLTMAYAYWRAGRHEEGACFELFFRRNPFGGEFTVFAGLEEALRLLARFRFEADDLTYLRSVIPAADPGFFGWLGEVDASALTVHAVPEGTLVFPRAPLLRVEGPLALCQLAETPLLNLVNYPSLVATQAARMRLAAGPGIELIEFGLRRAQGPDGAVSASRYSILGGFDATSNVLAGKLFGIPVRGTNAHSFVSAFRGLGSLGDTAIATAEGEWREFLERVLHYRRELDAERTNEGELAAFTAYAQAFPDSFLCLVDTYDTLRSGVPNFLAVALALAEIGHAPVGIRLDSGDLAYLSREARRAFVEAGRRFGRDFDRLRILASNEISESVLAAMRHEGHSVDAFGIGAHLVTCPPDGALGGVYKLMAVHGEPRLKISEELGKTTLPGRKQVWRLRRADGTPLADLLTLADEPGPEPGRRAACRHPFDPTKRMEVIPASADPLLAPAWRGARCAPERSLEEMREALRNELARMRPDHLRLLNPTPYKVSVSERLHAHMKELLRQAAPDRVLE